MEQATFFPGASRRVILSSVTLQKDRKIKCTGVRMPLTGESIQSQPEWLDNAFVAVSKSFTEVEPEVQQISDLSITFANHPPGEKPDTELFEGPEVKAPGSELKKLIVLRTGDTDDPEVSLQFNLYAPFTRPLWKWLGEMGGQEVHMSFPSGAPAVFVSPAQTFIDDRPELDPKHDAEFSSPQDKAAFVLGDEPTLEQQFGDTVKVDKPVKSKQKRSSLTVN